MTGHLAAGMYIS